MAYRNGTYVAFDGLGKANPSESDYRYYSTIQMWSAGKHIEFKMTNSHEKTYAVKDTSSTETLKARIRERLASSKQMAVILSSDTRKSGSMLSYEIEQAVDRCNLPLLCAYPEFSEIYAPGELSHLWPSALRTRIENGSATAIHFPFNKNALFDAMNQFSVHDCSLSGGLNWYTREAHASFGCISR